MLGEHRRFWRTLGPAEHSVNRGRDWGCIRPAQIVQTALPVGAPASGVFLLWPQTCRNHAQTGRTGLGPLQGHGRAEPFPLSGRRPPYQDFVNLESRGEDALACPEPRKSRDQGCCSLGRLQNMAQVRNDSPALLPPDTSSPAPGSLILYDPEQDRASSFLTTLAAWEESQSWHRALHRGSAREHCTCREPWGQPRSLETEASAAPVPISTSHGQGAASKKVQGMLQASAQMPPRPLCWLAGNHRQGQGGADSLHPHLALPGLPRQQGPGMGCTGLRHPWHVCPRGRQRAAEQPQRWPWPRVLPSRFSRPAGSHRLLRGRWGAGHGGGRAGPQT